MNAEKVIEGLANISAILTACFAAWAWFSYKFDQHRKRIKLESYLKGEKENASDKGQRTTLHLMAHLGLTESEILQASFKSNHIKRSLVTDSDSNRSIQILFEYR
jgi:hypothetical protein